MVLKQYKTPVIFLQHTGTRTFISSCPFLPVPEEIKHWNHMLFMCQHLTPNCFPGFSGHSLNFFAQN